MVIQSGNSDNQSTGNFRLSKEEILRGYDSFQKIIQNSVLISTDFLRAFVNSESKQQVSIDIIQSPPVTAKVKVGFIIAKKRIRKAYQRNRIRRLLKESYRLNKNLFPEFQFRLNLIFGLNEKGYEYFKKNPKLKFEFINSEMLLLQKKIIKILSAK